MVERRRSRRCDWTSSDECGGASGSPTSRTSSTPAICRPIRSRPVALGLELRQPASPATRGPRPPLAVDGLRPRGPPRRRIAAGPSRGRGAQSPPRTPRSLDLRASPNAGMVARPEPIRPRPSVATSARRGQCAAGVWTPRLCVGVGREAPFTVGLRLNRRAVLDPVQPLLAGGQLRAGLCHAEHRQRFVRRSPGVGVADFRTPELVSGRAQPQGRARYRPCRGVLESGHCRLPCPSRNVDSREGRRDRTQGEACVESTPLSAPLTEEIPVFARAPGPARGPGRRKRNAGRPARIGSRVSDGCKWRSAFWVWSRPPTMGTPCRWAERSHARCSRSWRFMPTPRSRPTG